MTYIAAILWGGLVGLRMRQALDGDILAILLALQASLVAYRLVERNDAREEAPWGWRIMAWLSAMLPLGLQAGGAALIPSWASYTLGILGLLLALWALWVIGRAFGIAPADRGLIISGPYHWLRHPAYAGEILNALGYVLANARTWNWALMVVMALCLAARIVVEERLIDGYNVYAEGVRWRIIPGIW